MKINVREVSRQRSTNIELLRILSMLVIVFSHFAMHSEFRFSENSMALNQVMIQMARLGELGVAIFVIISGYFSVEKRQTVYKFLELFGKMWFYNVVIIMVLFIVGYEFTIPEIFKMVIPLYNTHWFAYTFVFLYILMPFINKFINCIDKRMYEALLFIFGFFWGVLHTFFGAELNYSYLGWFIFLYMVGAYIKLYGQKRTEISKFILVLTCCLTMLWLSTFIIDFVEMKIGIPQQRYGNYFYSLYSPFIFCGAVALFKLFEGLNIRNNITINNIASTTFGIYLISDNKYIRDILWNHIFNNSQFSDSKILLLIGLLEMICVFVICSILDTLTMKIFRSRLFVSSMQKSENHINHCMRRILSR